MDANENKTKNNGVFPTKGPQGWGPGQSGNPAGRPKGAKDSLGASLRRLMRSRPLEEAYVMLREKYPDLEADEVTHAVSLMHVLVEKGQAGSLAAIELAAKITGELTKTTNHRFPDGPPMLAVSIATMSLEDLSAKFAELEEAEATKALTLDVAPNVPKNGKNEGGAKSA